MIKLPATATEIKWMLSQIKPPEVVLLVYSGPTGCQSWKAPLICSEEEWSAIESDGAEKWIANRYPSATCYVVLKVGKPSDEVKATPTVRPIPRALFSCCDQGCAQERSWPANDINWSESCQRWVCAACWPDICKEEPRGISLEQYILDSGMNAKQLLEGKQ